MSSGYAASSADQASAAAAPVRRLDLSVNPEDGSLMTAPLSHVLLSATDALYSDLHSVCHGELDVVVTTSGGKSAGGGGNQQDNNEADDAQMQSGEDAGGGGGGAGGAGGGAGGHALFSQPTKRERMSNLSFAQRRHELQWRLCRHGKSLQHVAALAAAHASSEMGKIVKVSSRALQHARTAWMQADEAQDALYFFHAQLFPSRAPPLDVYGSCDVLLGRGWYDLPRDLQLRVDRYPSSKEGTWPRAEVDAQWRLAVRRKLVAGGEVAADGCDGGGRPFHLSLRGGILKLTHGHPRKKTSLTTRKQPQQQQQQQNDVNGNENDSDGNRTGQRKEEEEQYPVEALLTVLSPSSTSSPSASASTGDPVPPAAETPPSSSSSSSSPEWTLLSIEVRCESKTGEFNHQLETSNRQRYNLHRLAALGMSREEARARRHLEQQQQMQMQQAQQLEDGEDKKPPATGPTAAITARPLHALFSVAQTFLLSWQLELLSAQAQALRRGVWAATGGFSASYPLSVTPVKFFDDEQQQQQQQPTKTKSAAAPGGSGKAVATAEVDSNRVLGVLSVSFWKVDDSYGLPTMGDLLLSDDDNGDGTNRINNNSASQMRGRQQYASVKNQLTLSIRAESNVGIRVSLSGGASLLDASKGDPHLKSTIRNILDATCRPLALSVSDALLAATRLCALSKCQAVARALQPTLPGWIRIRVERGSLAIAARVRYYYGEGEVDSSSPEDYGMPVLFRLECDARTGSFVSAFSRQLQLLRRLACNSIDASEAVALRMASLPSHRRSRAGHAMAAIGSTGRYVSSSFDGLVRSMNLLGQRTGVGGSWDDIDDRSSLLRGRAVQSACNDVTVSLLKCCGLAALCGLFPLALGGAVGLDAVADM